MHARAREPAFAVSLVGTLCAWNNAVVPRLQGRPGYTAANVAATGVLVAAARAAGLSWCDLGLSRRSVRAGLRWGGSCSAVVACGYLVALGTPRLRPLLTDARVAGLSGGELAGQVLVRIPLGTVLWEEVAFRSVLLPVLGRTTSAGWATAGSAVVFGIWHVRPTLDALAANEVASGPTVRTFAVLSACLGTGAAGVLFTWLRARSGSLVAPVLLHLATNCLGVLAAAAAHRLRRERPG